MPLNADYCSRRRTLLAGLLAGLAAGCARLPVAASAPQGQRALVIGAGFAGLSAARALRQSGVHVTVLEARDRPGGRVMTDHSLGFPLDLGPSWLHGGPKNPLKAVADGAGISTRVTDYANFRFTKVSGGRRMRIAPIELLGQARKISDAMGSAATWGELRTRIASATDMSVADVFDTAVRRIEAREGPIDRGIVALQRWVLESNLAAPLEEVGAAALMDDSDTGASDDVVPPDDRLVVSGMDRMIDILKLDLDIRYGEVVRAVQWRPGEVKVSTGTKTWQADFAVVTLPVGVLAAGDVAFDPALPAAITRPLANLRMGLLNKVCLTFPRAFWDTRVDFLTFFSDPPPICYAWLNLTRYSGTPALVGFTSGRMAREVETMNDQQVADAVMRRIRATRRSSIPEPLAVRVSHWASDPYARGSYSYPSVGGSGRDRELLAVPLENTLFFAGEATHRDDPASVHGAWWSGLRAARQALDRT
jgi:monoamine oxidase